MRLSENANSLRREKRLLCVPRVQVTAEILRWRKNRNYLFLSGQCLHPWQHLERKYRIWNRILLKFISKHKTFSLWIMQQGLTCALCGAFFLQIKGNWSCKAACCPLPQGRAKGTVRRLLSPRSQPWHQSAFGEGLGWGWALQAFCCSSETSSARCPAQAIQRPDPIRSWEHLKWEDWEGHLWRRSCHIDAVAFTQ